MTSFPLDTIDALTQAINGGDLDGMMECFEEDAVLVVRALGGQAGQTARGKQAIRDAYAGFVAMKPVLRRHRQNVVEAGDLALHVSSWSLSAAAADGRKVDSAGTSADVLVKRGGRWLVRIYSPYGADPQMG
jgi:uncharacterized protein (TIGR02246 family)